MKQFDDLMQSYVATGLDVTAVEVWYTKHAPSAENLCALAESIGAAFLAGRLDFMAANGLLNQLMVLVGFEAAPKRFWEYYIAFEDFETSANPDTEARPAIAALAKLGAA